MAATHEGYLPRREVLEVSESWLVLESAATEEEFIYTALFAHHRLILLVACMSSIWSLVRLC